MSRHSISSARTAALSNPRLQVSSIGLPLNRVSDGGCLSRRHAPEACFSESSKRVSKLTPRYRIGRDGVVRA